MSKKEKMENTFRLLREAGLEGQIATRKQLSNILVYRFGRMYSASTVINHYCEVDHVEYFDLEIDNDLYARPYSKRTCFASLENLKNILDKDTYEKTKDKILNPSPTIKIKAPRYFYKVPTFEEAKAKELDKELGYLMWDGLFTKEDIIKALA